MDISLARTVGFVLGERKPLTFLYTYTFYGPLSVRIIGVWFFHPYHEFSGVPPDTILTMSLDLNFSPSEKKGY